MDSTTRISSEGQGGEFVLLSGEYSIHPKTHPLYRIEVTGTTVTCSPVVNRGTVDKARAITLKFHDIIGCDCLKGKDSNDTNGYLALYSYPQRRKLTSKKSIRKREVVTITFSKNQSYEVNIQEAARWKAVISGILQEMTITTPDVTQIIRRPPKKLLVLINPFSGPGKALQIFQERVVPIFAEAGLHFSMVVTERAGHAREICRNMKLDAWYGVIIVSGDGLIYEVINGLMERPDWENARHMPIGAIPGGSGNALCCTVCFHAGESFLANLVLHSAFVIAKHEVCLLDLVAVDTCRERIYSFLSVTWGIIADVDIESEKYRNLGNARFTVGAVARILGLRKYHGRLSFLPVEPYQPGHRSGRPHSISVTEDLCEQVQAGPTRSQSMIVVAGDRNSQDLSPVDTSVNGVISEAVGERMIVQSPHDLERIYPWTVNQDGTAQGNGLNNNEGVQLNVNSLMNGLTSGVHHNNSSSNSSSNSAGNLPSPPASPHLVPTPLLPKYSEPVPSDWVTIEDDFIGVAAVYQSHLSADFYAAPESKLDDGLIHLTFIRAPMSRGRLTQLFLSMENGSYLECEGQELVRVKAFRLEPLESNGTICVDGEKVDYGSIQAQVLPSMARILAKKPGV